MKCAEIQVNLLEYSRGLLFGSEAEAVRSHLEGCAGCRAALEAEIRLDARLSTVPMVEPRSDVWPLVQSRIVPQPWHVQVGEFLRGTFARRLTATAVAFIVLLVGLVTMLPRQISPDERNSINQVAALVQVQPISQEAQAYSDDTLASNQDDMLKVLENEM